MDIVGAMHHEDNYLMQTFFRAAVGTNNIDCCTRVCHSPTAHGMRQAFGTGAATNSIVINPRRTEMARYATHFLQLRPGINVAILNMIMHFIIAEELVAKDFVAERTEGYEEFCQELLDLDQMERV